MDKGHWDFFSEFDPDEWFGFIYRIIELNTNREYIGKKQFHEYRRKAIKGRKNKVKTRKESDWRIYTSSSTELNEAIKINGMNNYRFIIESLHKTRASLTYAEVKKQINEDVLRLMLSSGVKKYFNKQIGAIRFIPPAEHSEETRMKISEALADRYKITPHWRSLLSEDEVKYLNDNYYSGENHYLNRILTDKERDMWISNNVAGQNNPMFGIAPHNKGKTYEELYGLEKSQAIKTKLSLKCGKSGDENGMYGRTHSDEQKEKWKNDPKRKKLGSDNGMFGKPCYYNMSEEKKDQWRNNISNSTRGKSKSKEHSSKIGLAHKGKPKATHTCPHCTFVGRGGNMKRYHFDNCKHRTI